MNWALTADGMAYVPRHRAEVPVDTCSSVNILVGASGCPACAAYPGRHRTDTAAVTG